MELFELEDMRLRRKKQTIRLMEASDLTKQLLEAAERRDQVSLQMLLTMREEPIRQVQELEQGIQEYVQEMPEQDAIRMNELLYGAEAATEQERALTAQVAQYRRILESVVALDRKLSLMLDSRGSIYSKLRDE